jgi:hypothetical protein
MITTYERGITEGILRGERRLALAQLEAKFGPLTPEVRRRLDSLPPEELRKVMLEYYKAQSLKELGLEG